jgi:hypothetical protein
VTEDVKVTSAEQAHAVVGGFILRCSVLNYRAGQMIAHWFCTDEREKFLSYVAHSIDFQKKKDIVAERLTRYHPAAAELKAAMGAADEVMQRRDLVVGGLLSGPPEGPFFVKSFSAARFLRGEGQRDVLPVAEIPAWSAKAVSISEEIVRLTNRMNQLKDKA